MGCTLNISKLNMKEVVDMRNHVINVPKKLGQWVAIIITLFLLLSLIQNY